MRIDPTFGIESINIRVSICNAVFKMVVNSKLGILLWSESSHKSTGFAFPSHLTLSRLFSCVDMDWGSETRDRVTGGMSAAYVGRAPDGMTGGVKSSGGDGAEGSRRGGEERGPRHEKTNLTHLAGISCAVCHYQHVYSLCLVIEGDEASQVSRGSKEADRRRCLSYKGCSQKRAIQPSLFIRWSERDEDVEKWDWQSFF